MKALMVAFNKSIATEFNERLTSANLQPRELTPQQGAFVEAFRSQTSSILGEAVAGSGKTYTLLYAALSLPATTWDCKTMHGLGYSAWSNKIGRRLNVYSGKMFKILRDSDLEVDKEDFSAVLKLATIGKTYGIVPVAYGSGDSLTSDDYDTWEELAEQHEIDLTPQLLSFASQLLCFSITAAFTGQIDFDDMLYMPVCFSGIFLRYPLVVVDEAQDLSAIQHEMIGRVLDKKRGILIGAGDRHQAIYGFRGALSESIPQLVQTFNMDLYPLTVSFRCPKLVVREAQRDVPHIESAPTATLGSVTNHDDPDSAKLSLKTLPPVVLCRNTAPIVALALHLIADGRGATIAGREIGKHLVNIVKSIAPKKVSVPAFQVLLGQYITKEIAKKPRMIGALRDREAAIDAVANRANMIGGESASTTTIISIIEELFKKGAPGAVYLSTIHRAKGLEWPDVLLLDPQLIPSCYASQPWQLQQERNIRYVAVTRAQQNLHYSSSDNIIQ